MSELTLSQMVVLPNSLKKHGIIGIDIGIKTVTCYYGSGKSISIERNLLIDNSLDELIESAAEIIENPPALLITQAE